MESAWGRRGGAVIHPGATLPRPRSLDVRSPLQPARRCHCRCRCSQPVLSRVLHEISAAPWPQLVGVLQTLKPLRQAPMAAGYARELLGSIFAHVAAGSVAACLPAVCHPVRAYNWAAEFGHLPTLRVPLQQNRELAPRVAAFLWSTKARSAAGDEWKQVAPFFMNDMHHAVHVDGSGRS